MAKANELAARLRYMARHERKEGSAQSADTLEAAAFELERLLDSLLFSHRMNSERRARG